MPVYLNDMGMICALGRDRGEVSAAVFGDDRATMLRGVVSNDEYSPGAPRYVGVVNALLPAVDVSLARHASRNNQLLLAALEQIRPAVDACIDRLGSHRVGIAVGTSTSGIAEGERAVRAFLRNGSHPPEYRFAQQHLGSGASYLAAALGVNGPALTVSTACASSAHAIASARRLLLMDACDAVVAGGADSLCRLTVQGFGALEALSDDICNPFSRNRDGINIGEGAALMLMTREPGDVELLGAGNTSDAHHISAPDPSGAGAHRAIQCALAQGEIEAGQVDYVNLHGTGTRLNDAMEAAVVANIFGRDLTCSSSKPMTGHTLGAAGAIEAGLCWLLLREEFNPARRVIPHLFDGTPDPDIPPIGLAAIGSTFDRPPRYVLSNSFAFGGNNAALLLGVGP